MMFDYLVTFFGYSKDELRFFTVKAENPIDAINKAVAESGFNYSDISAVKRAIKPRADLELFCAVCDEETEHRKTTDTVFEHALECLKCGTVWEAEVEQKEKD